MRRNQKPVWNRSNPTLVRCRFCGGTKAEHAGCSGWPRWLAFTARESAGTAIRWQGGATQYPNQWSIPGLFHLGASRPWKCWNCGLPL